LTDYQLSRKNAAFLNRDRFRGHVSFERRVPLNGDGSLSDHLSNHVAFDFDAASSHAAETLHIRLALDDDLPSHESARKFADKINRGRLRADQIAAQFSLDQGRLTSHARAAEIAFAGEMNITARANTAAKTGCNLVVAQVDVRAARRTICRYGRFADFVLSLALKTFDGQAARLAPGTAKLL